MDNIARTVVDKKLYITLDTEMDADIHWRKAEPKSFTSVTIGIPLYLRPIWDKYNVHPIYYVSPEVVEDDECCMVLREEISKGAIIGAHLHPEFIEPDKTWNGSGATAEFPCYSSDKTIERKKISNLKQLIENRLGVTPVWYRAGRFGADRDTWESLAELGFKYDSSVTPGIDWSQAGGPDYTEYTADSGYVADERIKELPITIAGKRCGALGRLLPDKWLYYRWLRPSHMTLAEEKRLIDELLYSNINEIVMMFHSMEIMINKTPFVRNRLMQNLYLHRLRKTIEYAQKKGFRTDV